MCVVNEERHSILLSFSISIDKTSRRETFSFEAKGSREMALKKNFISFYSEFRFCFLFWPALMENIFISWMLQTFVTFQLKILRFMSNPCKLNRINFISVYSKVKKKTRENLSNFTTVDHSTRMKKGPQWRISVEEKNMKNRKTFWFHHASSQEYERYQKKFSLKGFNWACNVAAKQKAWW